MKRSRPGFTLIELLVVVAIIAVLIALLLPAVQSARESARRAQCLNNLKQVGLALHNYHDSRRVFPPGSVGTASKQFVSTWVVSILPFVEQSDVYDRYAFVTNGGFVNEYGATTGNGPLLNNVALTPFWCPSNDQRHFTTQGDYTVAVSDYVGIAGAVNTDGTCAPCLLGLTDTRVATTQKNGHIASNGVLAPNQSISIDQISDGTSYTILVGEQSTFCTDATGEGKYDLRGSWQYGFAMGAYRNGIPGVGTHGWTNTNSPSLLVTTLKYPIGTKNGYNTADSNAGNNYWGGVNVGLFSAHKGGTHVLRADGSVNFVGEGVDLAVQQAYSIRDDHTVKRGSL